jgi:hypothetical protein
MSRGHHIIHDGDKLCREARRNGKCAFDIAGTQIGRQISLRVVARVRTSRRQSSGTPNRPAMGRANSSA